MTLFTFFFFFLQNLLLDIIIIIIIEIHLSDHVEDSWMSILDAWHLSEDFGLQVKGAAEEI